MVARARRDLRVKPELPPLAFPSLLLCSVQTAEARDGLATKPAPQPSAPLHSSFPCLLTPERSRGDCACEVCVPAPVLYEVDMLWVGT